MSSDKETTEADESAAAAIPNERFVILPWSSRKPERKGLFLLKTDTTILLGNIFDFDGGRLTPNPPHLRWQPDGGKYPGVALDAMSDAGIYRWCGPLK